MYSVRYKSHHDASRDLKARYTAETRGEDYLPAVLAGEAQSRRVVYLHVPFCNKICSFCPFHRPDELSRREYHHYLLHGMEKVREYRYMRAPIEAINFGGGTPTSLSPRQMAEVLEALHKNFTIVPGAEISLETSATELNDEMLAVLTAGGVNRLSIGIQTFDDGFRKMLGRRGSGEFAASRVAAAMRAGIDNVSVDLIYHYPGQTDAQLERDLKIISGLNVAGLSLYSLMLHEKTPLYRRLGESERAELGDLARERELFDMIFDELSPSGYRMLELTKLVKDNRDRYDYMEIRHSGGSCIALGHGAGGNIENYFYHNSAKVADVSEDIRVCSRGRVLLPEYRTVDALIYDMQKGRVDLGVYSERLGADLETVFAEKLTELEQAGYVNVSGRVVLLTRSGVFFGNNIISELVELFLVRRGNG